MTDLTHDQQIREKAVSYMIENNPSDFGCVYDAHTGSVVTYTTNEAWQDNRYFDVSTIRNDGKNETFDSAFFKWARNPES